MSTSDSDNQEPPSKRRRRERSPDIIDHYMQSIYRGSAAAASDSDFDTYISATRSREEDVPNIIAWWAKQRCTPLVRLALNVLSIPAISTKCERLFSSASDLVGTTRYSLHDDTMETLELLRQWLQHGFVTLRGEI